LSVRGLTKVASAPADPLAPASRRGDRGGQIKIFLHIALQYSIVKCIFWVKYNATNRMLFPQAKRVGNPSEERFRTSLPAFGGAEVYPPPAAPKATRGDRGRSDKQGLYTRSILGKFAVALCFCILFSIFLIVDCRASETEDNIAKIQKAYEEIRDLKGSFIQKSIIKDLNKTEIYKGEFFIKPPLKMKWIYKGKTAQDLIINNDTVLIIKKTENQAYRSKFDRATYGQTPVALLSGFGNVKEEFNVSGKGEKLILQPKKPMGNVTSITIIVSDAEFPIRSFTINDTYSNIIEIVLKDVKVNTGMKDSLFDLTLPKGFNLFEQ